MYFGYLFIDDNSNGFNQLKKSIEVLKSIEANPQIIIFNNQKSGRIVDYCKSENITHKLISLSRNYISDNNLLNILVEKIISLRDFDENEDIVLLDIDTTFIKTVPENTWNEYQAVLWNAEYYIMEWRNLINVLPLVPWEEIEINFNDSYVMYNTGTIYIPKKNRKRLCEKTLWIVDYLNSGIHKPKNRAGNKLDEQIAISIVLHNEYGQFGNIKYAQDFIYHYWAENQKGIKWWE